MSHIKEIHYKMREKTINVWEPDEMQTLLYVINQYGYILRLDKTVITAYKNIAT